MILKRLRVRGKMTLLILLPLLALVSVATPFITVEVSAARSAAATAGTAHSAQALSNLIYQLQRERLLTAAFLVSPADDGAALRQQHDAAAAAAKSVQSGLSLSDELAGALTRVGSLGELRDAALHRGTSPDSVARAYHAVIQALIDALRLVPQRTGDAEGTRQLTALDALLNANEQSALRGMALIATAIDPQTGRALMDDAASRAQQFIERFVEQADTDQADQVVQVELGDAGRQVDAAAAQLPTVHGGPAIAAFAAQALAAVDTQAKLRRTVQDQVTGEIADAAGGRAGSARDTAVTTGVGTALLFVLVTALTVALGRSIARPLQNLTRAAASVADLADAELARVGDVEESGPVQPPRLAAIEVASADEVGQLAQAFNRVQATAARLIERQVVSRHNVSLMFTNVARRTRNLVGRQLAVVDDLEREEQNAPLLARLYQLDHLATRLRRTAENLLVLAGSQEEARIRRPTPLTMLLRAALTEIEDFQRVRFHPLAEVVVGSAAASDLMLIFAELLENATAFSPPESAVEVHAEMGVTGCLVSIVDRGIGMNPQRMLEENHRLIERERLDIAPTTVLGLFVVGRLARRHGLQVRLRPTAGGGTTADVAIPAVLLHQSAPASAVARPSETWPHDMRPLDTRHPDTRHLEGAARPNGTGTWSAPKIPAQRTVATVGAPVLVGAGALRSLPIGGFDWFARRLADGQGVESHEVAFAPTPPPTGAPPVPGMARRVPGAHLSPDLRDRPPVRPAQPPAAWQPRDPADVQATFDSYSVAWRRAGNGAGNVAGTTADRSPDRAHHTAMEGYQ